MSAGTRQLVWSGGRDHVVGYPATVSLTVVYRLLLREKTPISAAVHLSERQVDAPSE